MAEPPPDIECPLLDLSACSVEEHCLALIRLERLPFLWHLGVRRVFGNYSLPFRDAEGQWWHQVKPGLCWPVDFFRPFDPARVRLPFGKTFLGYQHIVADEASANSRLVINTIQDLGSYSARSISHNRRKMVRKGLRKCRLSLLKEFDASLIGELHSAWRDLRERTGWRSDVDRATFEDTWRMLLQCPGTSIIVGHDASSGEVAGFLVTKIIGDTAQGDTIASRTNMLSTNINDALVYAFFVNAARIPGVTKVNYAIKSTVTKLEQFKTGMGLSPVPFPAVTRLRPGVGAGLRLFFPAKYNRMTGRFEDLPAESPQDEQEG
jgi:hypothetical protein